MSRRRSIGVGLRHLLQSWRVPIRVKSVVMTRSQSRSIKKTSSSVCENTNRESIVVKMRVMSIFLQRDGNEEGIRIGMKHYEQSI